MYHACEEQLVNLDTMGENAARKAVKNSLEKCTLKKKAKLRISERLSCLLEFLNRLKRAK